MAVSIPPMLKYSIDYNLLNFPLILIKFVSKLIVCKVLYFKAQYLLRLRSPLTSKNHVKTHFSCLHAGAEPGTLWRWSLLIESLKFQPRHSISYKTTDQPLHTHILSRINVSLISAKQCRWSACAFAQADLSHCSDMYCARPIWCHLNKF